MDIFQILATTAGLLIVIAGLPQAYRVYQIKESKGVSIWMFLMFFIAQGIWLSYGLHLNDLPLIISNSGALLVSGLNICLILRYQNGKTTN